MEDNKKVWCLFGIDNLYDQPDNNLHLIWNKKPTIEIIENCLYDIKNYNEGDDLVNLYNGLPVRIGETTYRIEEVEFDKPLKQS